MIKTFNIETHPLNYEFNYNPTETHSLQTQIKNNQNITIDDIRRIALWKLDRVLEVSDKTIFKLQKIATIANLKLEDSLVIDVIKSLTESNGIGFPMASAILKFIRPDIFPIIDVRAYRALYGKKIYSSQYSFDKYIEYTKDITEISNLLNISLSQIDEQLYCFDKEYNGKI